MADNKQCLGAYYLSPLKCVEGQNSSDLDQGDYLPVNIKSLAVSCCLFLHWSSVLLYNDIQPL